jgi:hypothetical protein
MGTRSSGTHTQVRRPPCHGKKPLPISLKTKQKQTFFRRYIYVFYVSKFMEFADTFIMLSKAPPPRIHT